jgi:hypothetical protein
VRRIDAVLLLDERDDHRLDRPQEVGSVPRGPVVVAERHGRQLPAPQPVVVGALAGIADTHRDELGHHLVADEAAVDRRDLREVPVPSVTYTTG